jgi:hypothetical protein
VIRAALALVLLASPAQSASFVDRAHCWAYPHHERCHPPRPAPPEPVQAPVVAPPPVFVPVAPPPQVTPVAPPVAAPVVVGPAPVKRVKTKAAMKAKPVVKTKPKPPPKSKWKKAKPKTCNPTGPGPDLPYPCLAVRFNAGTKSCRALAAEGRSRGITLTPKQHCQAALCIGRCFPPR